MLNFWPPHGSYGVAKGTALMALVCLLTSAVTTAIPLPGPLLYQSLYWGGAQGVLNPPGYSLCFRRGWPLPLCNHLRPRSVVRDLRQESFGQAAKPVHAIPIQTCRATSCQPRYSGGRYVQRHLLAFSLPWSLWRSPLGTMLVSMCP